MTRKVFPVVLLLALASFSSVAFADIIASNASGTGSNTLFFGQSVTTPSGGPWNNVVFNFFSDPTATTPTAAGTVYLLTQSYTGAPNALSSGTAGFLASAAAAGGFYTFSANVTLQPGTQYFFYTDTINFITGGGDSYSGGSVFFSPAAGTNYAANSGDADFRLQGSVVTAVPEPSSLMLLGTGLSALAGGLRRKLRR